MAPKSNGGGKARSSIKKGKKTGKSSGKTSSRKPVSGNSTKKATLKMAKKTARKPAPKTKARFPEFKAASGRSTATKPVPLGVAHGKIQSKLHHRKLSAKEVQELRKRIIDRRRQLYGDVNTMENEAFSDATREISTNHIADSSANQYEQDFTLHMIESETNELRMIEHALNKIDKTGTYGQCESCGIWISVERLRAQPHARICIYCVDKFEREGGGENFGILPAEQKY